MQWKNWFLKGYFAFTLAVAVGAGVSVSTGLHSEYGVMSFLAGYWAAVGVLSHGLFFEKFWSLIGAKYLG